MITMTLDDARRLGGLDHATTRKRPRRPKGADAIPTFQHPDTLVAQCKMGGLPVPVREYKFGATRGWAFDCAWPDRMIALEVDGATWANGRHTRGSGWLKDQEKLNEAAILGWRVLHVTPEQVNDWSAFGLVERVLR